jgi:hypothetical protein
MLAGVFGCGAGSEGVGPGVPCESVAMSPAWMWNPTWDPSATRLAFLATRDPRGNPRPGLYVADLEARTFELVVDQATLGTAFWVQWSPVADSLAMVRNGDVWILDLGTRAWARVTDGTRQLDGMAWGPEGDWVYYTRSTLPFEPLSEGGLHVQDIRYGLSRHVVSRDSALVWPLGPISFAPDREWFTYTAAVPDPVQSEAFEVFAMRRDGRERRQLTFLGGEAVNPRWLGDRIVFDYLSMECRSQGALARHTWEVRPDGSGLHRRAVDLGDPRILEGFPPALGAGGERTAFVGLDHRAGVGVLFAGGRVGPWRPVFSGPWSEVTQGQAPRPAAASPAVQFVR